MLPLPPFIIPTNNYTSALHSLSQRLIRGRNLEQELRLRSSVSNPEYVSFPSLVMKSGSLVPVSLHYFLLRHGLHHPEPRATTRDKAAACRRDLNPRGQQCCGCARPKTPPQHEHGLLVCANYNVKVRGREYFCPDVVECREYFVVEVNDLKYNSYDVQKCVRTCQCL